MGMVLALGMITFSFFVGVLLALLRRRQRRRRMIKNVVFEDTDSDDDSSQTDTIGFVMPDESELVGPELDLELEPRKAHDYRYHGTHDDDKSVDTVTLILDNLRTQDSMISAGTSTESGSRRSNRS